jgi:hypothetical protein
LGTFCFWYSSMTFQHQFHLKLDFSQMIVYCTGTYTQRKTVKSCKKTYIEFLLKNPSNLFALLVMFPIWVFQVRLIDNVSPRYFASLTSSNICPLRV